jgi:ABC-type glutathione transport system ATPase component
VKVHLVGLGEIRLSFAADSERFSIDPPEPKMLLAGYGATRLLPSEAQRAASSAKYIRVMNLFDPVAPLNDVESWLVQQLDKTNPTHADFQESLRLLFPEVERIEIASGHVLVWIGGDRIPLHDLSDGFQSLIALLGDIAITVSDYWPSLRVAEGLVLLDEIETHLHPRWKIEIVERLRAACPQLTFLVTTHDPLCLKGLEDTEIAVLRRTPGTGVTVEVNSVSLTHLRWDQLLSSFLFNLPSSRSSAAPAMVARYSRLLGKPDKTPAEHEEMTRLRKDVTAQFSSALTPMQRSVENAVLRTLGDNDAAPPNREDVKLEVRRQVVDLLDTGEHTS